MPEVLPAPGTANPLVEVVAPAGLTDDVERENTERRAARGKARQALDKYIERRAVHVAKVYLANQGWRLHRDCQKLGVGYDLEFRKGDSSLNVEVKGIQGSSLSFNMTALEWARVVNDPDFIVIAVTGVIQATTTQVHILTRDRLAAGERRVVQYRMNLL
nr:DUF3883 domain-containing protein [Microlunatus antarcticus]